MAVLVVYGSVKNHSNERGEMSNEIGSESGFNRVERVDGGESGFNAEKAEAQEAQRGEGGDFNRVDRVATAAQPHPQPFVLFLGRASGAMHIRLTDCSRSVKNMWKIKGHTLQEDVIS